MVAILCDYDNWAAFLVAWARRFPLLIGFFMFVAGYATGEPIFTVASWTLTFALLCLYPWKFYFNVLRLDPFCPSITSWAFPNDEMLYVSFVVVFVIGYALYWGNTRSPFQWICLGLVFLGPSIILLWFDGLWWVYLAITCVIGTAVAIGLLWWLWTHEDMFVFIFVVWPLSYLYSDTILVRNAVKVKKRQIVKKHLDVLSASKRKKLDAELAKLARMSFSTFV